MSTDAEAVPLPPALCCDEIEKQRRVDACLAKARRHLAPPPAACLMRIDKAVRVIERRRKTRVLFAGAAAAVLLIALGVGVLFTPKKDDGTSLLSKTPRYGRPLTLKVADPASTPHVHVSFAPETTALAAPIKTADSDITIFFLYSTLKETTGSHEYK